MKLKMFGLVLLYILLLANIVVSDTQITDTYIDTTGNITSGGNITAEIFYGQPIDGGFGSGILNSSDNKDNCGCINVSDEGGLDVKYPDLKVRIWDYGTTTYCDISEDTVTVPDDAHTVYYINDSCDVANTPWATYFALDLNPPNYARIFDVFTESGEIGTVKGATVIGMSNRKSKWNNVNCGSGGHLSICDGLDITEDVFPKINQSSGHYIYVNTIHTLAAKESADDNLHIVTHSGGDWTHLLQTGINVSYCDNGTDFVACTPTKYRRYLIYSIGWGETHTKIHQLAPVIDETYNTLLDCLNLVKTPLSYTLPSAEDGVAVVHHVYCAKDTDSAWGDGWIDIRAGTNGFGAIQDLSNFLSYDGLTKNWDVGNWNITAEEFIADSWSDVIIASLQISDILNYMNNATLYSMFYNRTEIDTQGEMESIWSVSLATDTEVTAANSSMKTYVDALDVVTNTSLKAYIDGSYYLRTAIDTQAEMEAIWGVSLATDTEVTNTNTSMKTYVDAADSAQDECSEITNCVPSAITEIDNWATDINNYPSACNSTSFIRGLGDTLTCEEPSYIADTSANTECSGTTTYMDGDGGCDDISGVYVQASSWTTIDNYPPGCNSTSFVRTIGDTLTCEQPVDTDTTYTAGDALTLTGTDFDFDGGASPGGELGGTWASPTLDHDALDDQYYDSEADLTALLDDNYEGKLNNEAGLYAALSDVSQFYEVGDKVGDADTLDTHDTSYFQTDLTDEASLYSALSDVSMFLEDLVDDTTPQLGGDLDCNTHEIQIDSADRLCLNGATCTKYLWYNGSNVQIVG